MKQPPGPLRVALVGTRHPHSYAYQELICSMPELEVVAVADLGAPLVRAGAAHAVDPAARWGEPGRMVPALTELPAYTSLDAMPTGAFEAALLFLPNDQAPAAAIQLARAGRHLFCEKPVARSSADMLPIARAVEEAGVQFAAGYTWRSHPGAQTVHEWIAGGVLGRIHSVEARMVTSAVRHRNPEHYLFNAAVSGGGILSWLGCHWLDLIRYLTGLEVEAAGAITGNVGNPPVEVEEIAALSLRFAGGAIGTLHAAYVLPEGYETYLGVRGELGWIRWDPTGNVIEANSQHPSWRDEPRRTLRPEKMQFPGYGTDGRSALLTWLAAIRGEAARPAADQRDALRTLEVIDAAYASANSGRLTSVRDSLAAR